MPRLLLGGLALTALTLLASCGSASSTGEDPVAAADLPEPFCSAVPAGVVERWSLTADDEPPVEGDDARRTATCVMSGRSSQGEPVTLEITMTTYGGDSREEVLDTVAEELAQRCDALEGRGATDGDRENRCGASAEDGTSVTEVSRSLASLGVVTVTMSTTGDATTALAAEVAGLSGTFANGELD